MAYNIKKLMAPLAFVGGLAMACVQVQASTIQVLQKPASEAIQHIGTAPVKKEIVLDLGKIRTREARLPDGVMTLQQRNLKRARLAMARQVEVTNAGRDRLKRLRKERQGGTGGELPPPAEKFDYEAAAERRGGDTFNTGDDLGGDLFND